jgi:hypothetical protein
MAAAAAHRPPGNAGDPLHHRQGLLLAVPLLPLPLGLLLRIQAPRRAV